jgi:two-component system response regulator BaeR
MAEPALPDAKSVLIAEDEVKIAQVLSEYLEHSGFRPHHLDNGYQVIDYVRREAPDLLLLDIMLPGKDGLTLCRELRAFSQIPIIMITARVEEIDRLLGLELGADDYICKPFSPREVIARVKAIFRRLEPRSDPSASCAQGFSIDSAGMLIRYDDQVLNLTPKEYKLLSLFLNKPGRVFSRDFLLDRLDEDFRDVSDRAIDSHIKNLRKKIASVIPYRTVIHSIYGAGYKFDV